MSELLLGSVMPAPPITVSGLTYVPLTQAEAMVLNGFRWLVQQGDGNMYVEFRRDQQGRSVCTKWDVHPNFGGARAINAVMGVTQLRD